MKKTAFAIMIITVASKILGFGREVILSYFYGASTVSDAYLISLTIPGVIFSFIRTGITTGFIPMYSRIDHERGPIAANRFTSNLTSAILIFCTLTIAIGLVFTRPLVRIFASGFSKQALELAVSFTRVSIFAIYFSGLVGLFGGYLSLHKSYLVPNLIGFPMNIIIILSLIISGRTTIYVLLLGTLIARASELFLMVPFVRKKKYRFEPVLDLRDDNLRLMVSTALPVIIGTSVNQINVLVDRTLASGIAVGGISALNYADRLNGLVQGLFVASISSVMYPMISKMASEHNINGLKATLSEAIGMMSLMVVPATVGAVVFAEPIVRLLFERGAFTQDAVVMTSSALKFYSVGMVAFGMREILSRAFYAMQDTRTPMVNGTIAVAINIVLNIILSQFLGLAGLALATSVAGMVGAILLLVSLRRIIGGFELRETVLSFGKISAAAVLMGLLSMVVYRHWYVALGPNLSLLSAIGVGALCYFLLTYLFRVPVVERTVAAVRNRLGAGGLNDQDIL